MQCGIIHYLQAVEIYIRQATVAHGLRAANLLGLGNDVRNELVYLLAAKWLPLELHIVKQVFLLADS